MSQRPYVEPQRLIADLQRAEVAARAERERVKYPCMGVPFLRWVAWLFFQERIHRAERDVVVASARVSVAMQMQEACDMAAVRRGKRV